MLPVAELHLHIEGTLEPELLVKLAGRNGTWMPTLDVDELHAQYQFDSLQSFLDLYYASLRMLKPVQEPGHDRAAGRTAVPGRVDHQGGEGDVALEAHQPGVDLQRLARAVLGGPGLAVGA
jgi:hypothetical protein